MKTKLKIGDKVRVINKKSINYLKYGKIVEQDMDSFKVRFGDYYGTYDISDLQLIKPKTKWKYSRKEISQKLNYFSSGRYKYIENVVEDLLAKSEYTEDKSDKLKRPTLPEKIEGLPASLQYEMRDNILATLANKLNELIDNQNQIISFLEEMK